MIAFLPILLLVELFKRSKRYNERKGKISEILLKNERCNQLTNEIKRENYIEIKKKRRLRFSWWIKIIAYLISHLLIIISAVLVIIKGIDCGDQSVCKWLTSLLFALISSVFLTQPFQVKLYQKFLLYFYRSFFRHY
jgi:ABC-type transport system involved in cytochrome bd biosynthesis fused ATPase/permease subunit